MSLVGPAAAAQSAAASAQADDSIRILRLQAEYARAAVLAREELVRLESEAGTPAWQVQDARNLLRTLEAAALLPVEEQRRLAAADRLGEEHRRALARDEGAEARTLAEEQLAIRTEILSGEHLEVADSLCALGLYHDRAWQDHDLGVERYRRCLEIRQEHLTAPHPDLASALAGLGIMLRRMDSWDEAETLMRQGLEMRLELFGEDHPDTAASMHHLAILLVRYRRLDEAQELYEKALAVHRRTLTHESRLLPENMVALGLVHRDRGHYSEAEALFREALEVTRKRVGDESWYVSWIQIYIGAVLMYRGEMDEAEALLAESEARLRRIDPDHLQLFQVLDVRGRLAMMGGDYARADAFLTEALARNRSMRGTDANYGVVQSLERLAMARYRLGRPEEAETLLEEAVAGFEEARLRVSPGLSRARFTQTPYPALAVMRLERGRSKEAWEAIERSRGRVLADLVQSAGATSGIGPVLGLPQVQAALDDRTAIVGWLDYHLFNGEPRFWGYVIRHQGPVRWERLGDLGAGASRRQASPGGEARSVDPDLSLPHELHARLQAFRRAVGESGSGLLAPVAVSAALRRESRELWRQRIGPLVRHLDGVDRLVIVSSWAMGGVPLEVMEDDAGRMLGERYATTYAPSATLHARLSGAGRSRHPDLMTGLLLGDPPFRVEHVAAMRSGIPPQQVAGVERSILRGVLDRDRTALGQLPRLPSSREEVSAIALRLDHPVVLVGEDAAEARLVRLERSGDLARYDVIHLATHAVVDESEPERSALVLSQVDLPAESDGMLTAREILERWRLDARLVTLSACETGLGENLFGEGLVGFSYPFLKAGAESLLVSLWKVDDRATALLMDRFYDEWLGDLPPGEAPRSKAVALQRAKLWLRDYRDESGDRPYAHPYYWSAFVLVGRPD